MSSHAPNGAIDYKTLVQDDRIHASLYTDPQVFDDEMGHRYSQEPASPMRRLIANIEVAPAANGELVAESNFALAELAIQATRELHWWVGRAKHRLRRVDGDLRMCRKMVVLVNAAEPLPNLSFLI